MVAVITKNHLTADWFNRPVLDVAPELLGKLLIKKDSSGEMLSAMITEVEAYDGPNDKACHAHKGKTERTAVMFGPAGHWYVYFVYGIHWMLNIVTGPVDYPAAVLIRGVQGISGPARLTKRWGIDREYNTTVAEPNSGLWIADNTISIRSKQIERTPRIGVDYAEEWAKKPYRFVLHLDS